MREYPIIDGPQGDALRLMDPAWEADPGSDAPHLVWLFDVPATTVYYEQWWDGSYPKIDLYLDEAQTTQIAETTADHATICTLGGVAPYTTEGRLTFIAGTDTHTGTLEFTAAAIQPALIGTIPGVRVAEAALVNGIGSGWLKYTAAGLAWKAPGSATYGPPVPAPSDDDYTLLDGEDASKWIEVEVWTAYLELDTEHRVQIADRFNNVYDDVSKAEFDAGGADSRSFGLYNPSLTTLTRVGVWNLVNPAEHKQLTITETVSTTTPTEAAPTWLRDLRPGCLNTLLVETTPPDDPGVPDALDWLRFTWAGE